MERRLFLRLFSLLGIGGLTPGSKILALAKEEELKGNKQFKTDREYWVFLLDKMASPVMANMAKGELHKNMEMQYSPTWDGRNKKVGYLEAFGRLLAGIAPWFNLAEDDTPEGLIRKRLHGQTLLSIKNAVDPQSPDYLLWYDGKTPQSLVDAAYVAHALIRAPKALWEPLGEETKKQLIAEFKNVRKIRPFNSNWVLFATITESFLLMIGEEYDAARIDNGINKIQGWYKGDGWYSDGPTFAFDHYNGYDMHCMLVESLRINVEKGRRTKAEYDTAYKRMQRYGHFQERFISPEGYYLLIGRSLTYRTAAFQPLAQLALENKLPDDLKPAQVRSALTAVLKHVFIPATFTNKGWLQLGLVGDKQETLADYYSNTGSMYIASLIFLPLGLPADNEFWSAPAADWTSKKAWSGQPFPKDYAVDY